MNIQTHFPNYRRVFIDSDKQIFRIPRAGWNCFRMLEFLWQTSWCKEEVQFAFQMLEALEKKLWDSNRRNTKTWEQDSNALGMDVLETTGVCDTKPAMLPITLECLQLFIWRTPTICDASDDARCTNCFLSLLMVTQSPTFLHVSLGTLLMGFVVAQAVRAGAAHVTESGRVELYSSAT